MSSTPKQRVMHSLTIVQSLHNRDLYADTIKEFRDIFEQAAQKIFKGKHTIEYYPSSIVAATNKRQMVIRVDSTTVSLEKQLFTASGCKSFITQGQTEVKAKLQALIDKE